MSAGRKAPPVRTTARRYAAAAGREVRARAAERRVRRSLADEHRCTGSHADPIVSLTSFPARIDGVHLTLRSLLTQSRLPGRVELVLSEDEFPGRELPGAIRELEPRGVQVLWTSGNLRSFKKLVPLLDQLAERVVVTVDDDVVYPATWLHELWVAHLADPRLIWGTRGREIMVADGRLQPYDAWPFADASTSPEHTLLTGMGGVLYPPGALPGVSGDMATAMRLCPRADDVWFKACAMVGGTDARQLPSGPLDLPTRWRGQRSGLTSTNLHRGENDRQLYATFDHFGLLPRLGATRSR